MADALNPETDSLPTAPTPAMASAAQSVLSGASPNQPNAQPDEARHSAVGKIFHAISDTLAGGQREPQIDASGNVSEEPVQRTGGEWARRILAGALTGMAAGSTVDPREHRGGAALAGLGAGFEGEQQTLAKQDTEKRQQLERNFKAGQEQKQ